MTSSQNPETQNGTFWQVETPDRRVSGELTLGDQPALETLQPIFDERTVLAERSPSGVVTRMAVRGSSEARVADWEERNIHGLLSDGTPVSVVGAQGGMKRASMMSLDYHQEFTTMRHVILNEHIDDRTPFYSCRFRVTGPIWLEAEDEVAMTSNGGRLVVIRNGSECWFEFTPPEPLTIKDFGRWVLSPIATLASIITSNPADDIDLYARLRAESPWRQVHRPDESELPRARRELLSTSHLSSERFVRWIDFRKRSGALDAAAIDDFQGVSIQTEVLTLAAVAEGLHRRIFDGRKRVPAISTEDLAESRRAARGAALACLRDLDRSDRNPFTADDLAEFKRAMNDSFAFMNELTFRTRMAEIASTAKAAIPDIVTAFADWPKAVKDARNILAHQRALPYSESIDQFYDLLIAEQCLKPVDRLGKGRTFPGDRMMVPS